MTKQDKIKEIRTALAHLTSATKYLTRYCTPENLEFLLDENERLTKELAAARDTEVNRQKWMDFCERMAKAGTIKSRMPSFAEFMGNTPRY